ncbi:hypothetical protein UMM65_10615 [Aureibaculum sp. 2210JD6-5]|uniref:hypothetical protein n=1 Tax=Aureibaculum sp. 2210JD6-5 TaxID=3103957 RepID=UPI002AADE7CB|nr:hypothetical protein [Aureibaculum sp. 2210JD6-5]MDY7395696.1 hypothetical protein [Aureibaculum sp. 2210JD6-5]
MSKIFLISCDEATAICNKSQYKEASFWEILKLRFHIFMCKTCGLYSKQNATLTKVCNKHLHKTESEHKLCNEEKEVLQTEVVKRMK